MCDLIFKDKVDGSYRADFWLYTCAKHLDINNIQEYNTSSPLPPFFKESVLID